MSTDALREAWLDECAKRVEQWLSVDLELDRDPHDWSLEEWGQVRKLARDAIKSMWQPSTQSALAAPASETEKLPAKWRSDTPWSDDPEDYEFRDAAKQLEAALKADRQGG